MFGCFPRHCSACVRFSEKRYPLELRYCIAYDLVNTALPSMRMSMSGRFIDIVSIHLSIGLGDELCVFILLACSFVPNVGNVVNPVGFCGHFIAFES